jgi:hypothetical protein
MGKIDVLLDKNTLGVIILAILAIFGVDKLVAIDIQALANAIIVIIMAVVAIIKNRDAINTEAENQELKAELKIARQGR